MLKSEFIEICHIRFHDFKIFENQKNKLIHQLLCENYSHEETTFVVQGEILYSDQNCCHLWLHRMENLIQKQQFFNILIGNVTSCKRNILVSGGMCWVNLIDAKDTYFIKNKFKINHCLLESPKKNISCKDRKFAWIVVYCDYCLFINYLYIFVIIKILSLKSTYLKHYESFKI